ncbi:MAG TPA: hypothetical protein VL122_05140 [Nitrospirota bacterium]|nr:hypothetical protein [Nitrospirota bacterium]
MVIQCNSDATEMARLRRMFNGSELSIQRSEIAGAAIPHPQSGKAKVA